MITKDFITAGNATFTLEVPESFVSIHETRPHYTFKVDCKKADMEGRSGGRDTYFIGLLTGPDNESSYTYLGLLNPASGRVMLTKASKCTKDTWPIRLLRRSLACVWEGKGDDLLSHNFDLRHCGKCGMCGRKLTTPRSLENGIGPVCEARM